MYIILKSYMECTVPETIVILKRFYVIFNVKSFQENFMLSKYSSFIDYRRAE